jgi:hypothetical protein
VADDGRVAQLAEEGIRAAAVELRPLPRAEARQDVHL